MKNKAPAPRARTAACKRAAAVLLAALLGGCSGAASSGAATGETASGAQTAASDHEPLTWTTRASTDYADFIDALHEVYPEINIELISYSGYNTTEYSNVQLKAGDISDIFAVSYPPSDELQQENLIDLSGQDFISNINLKTVSDLSVDGAVYLLPTNMSLFGVYYNKTLFAEHGWQVPTSLTELEALIPQIEAAGVTLAECTTQYMGASFAYFFDTNAPEYFTTLDGISWMRSYLSGDAAAAGNLEAQVERFQHLIDLGLLPVGATPTTDSETVARFREGNTAFLITNSGQRFTQNEDGTGDEYGLLPYLSQDGSNNIIITNMGMYVGISKSVQDNPQKLEDALKVMSFLATQEGQAALVSSNNTLSPLKDNEVDESDPMYEMSKLVDAGKSMSLVYSGWEEYVTEIGENAYAMMQGKMTGEEFIAAMDALQAEVQAAGSLPELAAVEEDLTLEQTAYLVGAAYAKATGADCALISLGGYHGPGLQNARGVNGKIYASVPLTANVVSTFNPLSTTKVIRLMTLTGAEIKQFVSEGYFRGTDPTPFPYLLVTKEGVELDDAAVYTVACAEESDARGEQGQIRDSDVVGQDAIEEYLTAIGTVSSESILWK